ncbi:MAG: DUF2851 family protein [Chitinophagaceae bacterium]
MTERLLQFIWQFQYFNKNEWTTTNGETLHVIYPGQLNHNQGPDFQHAKIKIQRTTWAGNVELHLKTSDWKKHKHQVDANYSNVILHVVWEDDHTEMGVPVAELKGRVSKMLLQQYEEWMNSKTFIPCMKNIASVREIVWKGWKERLLAERLLRKATTIETYLHQNNHHWEEIFWWLLARNFGLKVNADAFEAIARSIPINILAKHKSQVIQIEAILLGQARLLDGVLIEDYMKLLFREYKFLKEKYKLKPIHQPVHFLRMRPGNFPTIRLAQLAMLINGSAHLFSRIREAKTVKEISNLFDVTANDYWHYHYRPGELSAFRKKKLGKAMIENIIINTVAPLLFSYGAYQDESKYKEKSLRWLEESDPETNSITNGFRSLKIDNKNAFDSQALIELKNEYCNRKRCLDCAIGNTILKR